MLRRLSKQIHSIARYYTRVFHADVNAASNILYRAAGNVVLRRPGHKEGYKPTPAMLRSIQQGRQKRHGNSCI
ncbi:MAG: hypothetical protein F4Y18_00735 [Cenarchaeum sp. SB0663_bin_5]|nr:hypothetical protein [Cenarchaeum sp. SB0663_bin_5]MYH04853.1 hypothetical protein [Cenarchaeum sp. SB0675_bin_21]